MNLIFLKLLSFASCDELSYVDYETSQEYNWSKLRDSNPYVLDLGTDELKFSIGGDLDETCEGQKASVILFSKFKDHCQILGRHEATFVNPIKLRSMSGVGVYYEGGSLCRDILWGDVKRRTEFKLICSEKETEFYMANLLKDCTTIIEKQTKYGCSKEFQYSPWVKVLFFT
jgi:hypothetical protein